MSHKQKPIFFLFAILGLGIGGVFGYEHIKQYRVPAPAVVENELQEPLAIRYHTREGVTYYSGGFPLASQCRSLSSGISAAATDSPKISLLFNVLESPVPCDAPEEAQIEEFNFSYTHNKNTLASAVLFESVLVNGKAVPYTLVEEH